MTLKSNKTLDTEMDIRWRRKGHSHIVDNKYIPKVCPVCKGNGQIDDTMCHKCEGTGEI